MNYHTIEKEVEGFVISTFTASSDRQFPYHNLGHTVDVVKNTAEIAGYYQLDEAALFAVKVAAWFHDIGHLSGGFEGHEERGITLMKSHLEPQQLPETLIASIAGCIRATKYPQTPGYLSEEILCDADTFHFGTPKFKETDDEVKKEMEIRTGKTFPEWHKKSIRLLEEHRFFTAYCRQLLDAGKQKNIAWLKNLPE